MLATKVGEDMGEGRSLRKDYILREADASLRRLQTDRIDLYQTHFDDEVTPPEETMAAYAQLIAQGKVRAVGASNVSPARLIASLAASKKLGLPRYESLQPLYNLYDRKEFESHYVPVLQGKTSASSPITRSPPAFLTGKYRSAADAAKTRRAAAKVKRYFDARGMRILKALDAVAARHGATPAQVSLAWLIARVTAPIVSATSLAQLNEIMQAPRLKLTREDIQALDKASAPLGARGPSCCHA